MSDPTRRERLEAIRDALTSSLAEADVANRAAIAKELRACIAEIDELADPQEVDALDELAARRPDPAPSKVPNRTGGSRKRRTAGD